MGVQAVPQACATVVLPEGLVQLVQFGHQRQADVQVHLQVLQPLPQFGESRSDGREIREDLSEHPRRMQPSTAHGIFFVTMQLDRPDFNSDILAHPSFRISNKKMFSAGLKTALD